VAPSDMRVVFAGNALSLICGAQQVNVRIPVDVAGPLNTVDIELGVQIDFGVFLNSKFIQNTPGTTIAVR
jgi:hypothetical protein